MTTRTVLLLGATGFIGSRLHVALRNASWDVVCGVRPGVVVPGCRCVEVDFTGDHSPEVWRSRLEGIDVVANAVGILRESGALTFEAVHVDAPTALFRACVQAGVRKIVQISALGADAQGVSGYHVSKRRGDDVLSSLNMPWVIVQPSLVFGEGGASAALFTRLAALPLVPVPGDGGQHVQPIHVDDLCAAIVQLMETAEHDRRRVAAVGPRPVMLREFLGGLREAMGLGRARFVRVPMTLVRCAAWVGDRVRGVLLDSESLGMLVRGNVASASRITAILGRPPRAVANFVSPGSASATANEARLAWLLPLLRVAVAIVWIVTGVVSLGVYPVADSYALLARVGLTGAPATAALYGAAALDLAFGIGVFVLRNRRWLWRAQMLLIAGYSVIIAIWLPEQWLHPYGPMLKNLPMLAAILMLHEFDK
jgi:uncharacterized protein YbjT (DUF2867 family)